MSLAAWAPSPLLIAIASAAAAAVLFLHRRRAAQSTGKEVAGGPADADLGETSPATPTVSPGVLDPDESVAGLLVYRLLVFPEWVNRRVETIEFLGSDTARRRVSIDFALPEALLGLDIGEVLDVVPVALMEKAPLLGFDIVDEEARPVSVASAARGVSLGQAALIAAAQALLEDEPLHPAVLSDLRAIPGGDVDVSRRHGELMDVAAGPRFAEELDTVLEDLAPKQREALETPWRQRIALMGDEAFPGLLRDLTESYLLLADLPPEPGRRRIFKFVFQHEVNRPEEHPREWLAARMGWIPTCLEITTPAATKARSYHCEIHAPPEMEITCARLLPSTSQHEGDEQTGALSLAHLHTPRLPVESDAQVVVWLRSSRAGFLRAALLTGMLSSALLWAGRTRLTELTGEVEAASTFLVLLPGLLAAYLAQPGEHELAASLRSGVRLALFGSGVCAVVAGALLVAHLRPDVLLFAWTAVSILSTFCLLLLLAADRLPKPGRPAEGAHGRRGLPL